VDGGAHSRHPGEWAAAPYNDIMLRALKVAAVKDELRAYAASEWSLFAQGKRPAVHRGDCPNGNPAASRIASPPNTLIFSGVPPPLTFAAKFFFPQQVRRLPLRCCSSSTASPIVFTFFFGLDRGVDGLTISKPFLHILLCLFDLSQFKPMHKTSF